MAADLSSYYINQSDYPDIKFKNNTTLATYGCVVCAYAMIACYKLKSTDKEGVIKAIIKDYTNDDGNFTNPSSMTIKGTKFDVENVSDMATEAPKGTPVVVRLKGVHNVVVYDYVKSKGDYSDYKILDPGKRSYTNLKQTMDQYGVTNIEYKRTLK